ncbi:Protein of unknown function [Pyronema omphalodes CBS 100304]|uniref:Uncharacterized protein n=1 Tax=Pyronema omphalodes (strain CBS 100304) TaxID=1076935 RepID=U4L613_PYROM|nr:Protein of unknown function [Pyronema omphalodes CBS 100304]
MSQHDQSFPSESSKSSPERSASSGFHTTLEEEMLNQESFEDRANKCESTSALRQFLKQEFPTLPRGYDHSKREPSIYKLHALLSRFKIQKADSTPTNHIEKQQFESAMDHIIDAQANLVQKLEYHIRFKQVQQRGEELEVELLNELITNMQLKMHKGTNDVQIKDIEVALAQNRSHIQNVCQRIRFLTTNKPAQKVLRCMEEEDSSLVDLYLELQAFLRKFGKYIEPKNLHYLKGFESVVGCRFKELERALLLHRSVLGIQSFDAYGRLVDAHGRVIDTHDGEVDTNDRY